MEQAPRAGRPGPAPGAPDPSAASWFGPPGTPPPDEVPEVAAAVGARALDLRRIAEQLHEAGGDDLAGALRAHAGHVDALAEHLRDAGGADDDPTTAMPTTP